jgi:hypothetical protein
MMHFGITRLPYNGFIEMNHAPKFFLVSLLVLQAQLYAQTGLVVKPEGNLHFSVGEELNYKVTFGFLTVGKATTRVDQQYYPVNGKPCYKVDAYGETSDWISWLAKVDDNWGAFLDTATISTQKSYRRIREGHYRLDEQTVFDHNSGTATVSVRDPKTGNYNSKKSFTIPALATDLIGGFIHLRFIDFNRLKKGDSISIVGFLEDRGYHLRILYNGLQTIQTALGKVPCHVLIPRMPENKLFEGENSITVWISQDQNKIPVKIQARMFIGSTGIELSSFRNLKNSMRIVP